MSNKKPKPKPKLKADIIIVYKSKYIVLLIIRYVMANNRHQS